MIVIFFYLLGAGAVLASYLYLNKHYKWLKQDDLDDGMPAIVFGTALWPLALLIIAIAFAAKVFFKLVRNNIPK